jgi:hypothetical protein
MDEIGAIRRFRKRHPVAKIVVSVPRRIIVSLALRELVAGSAYSRAAREGQER